MIYAKEAECEATGVDPVAIEALSRRLNRLLKDTSRLGITLFGGTSGACFRKHDSQGPLILAAIGSDCVDGGDGSFIEGSDGLERGET